MPNENPGNTLKVNGIELYYETQGAGEPLLLLHGGSGCHENWVYAGRDQFVRRYLESLSRTFGRATICSEIRPIGRVVMNEAGPTRRAED